MDLKANKNVKNYSHGFRMPLPQQLLASDKIHDIEVWVLDSGLQVPRSPLVSFGKKVQLLEHRGLIDRLVHG
jgi:hypothetical protein